MAGVSSVCPHVYLNNRNIVTLNKVYKSLNGAVASVGQEKFEYINLFSMQMI